MHAGCLYKCLTGVGFLLWFDLLCIVPPLIWDLEIELCATMQSIEAPLPFATQ